MKHFVCVCAVLCLACNVLAAPAPTPKSRRPEPDRHWWHGEYAGKPVRIRLPGDGTYTEIWIDGKEYTGHVLHDLNAPPGCRVVRWRGPEPHSYGGTLTLERFGDGRLFMQEFRIFFHRRR